MTGKFLSSCTISASQDGLSSMKLVSWLVIFKFQNRALRTKFAPKRETAMGGWRELYNEEFHYFYYFVNVIRMIKCRIL
jgi:hypothetical protein